MPRLRSLLLAHNHLGCAGLQALCAGLGGGGGGGGRAPSTLVKLNLSYNNLLPSGAEALAGALGRGALPKLEELFLTANHLGDQGVATLAVPLRALPALIVLQLGNNGIGEQGVVSLVASLGANDDGFNSLKKLGLRGNKLTDKGCATLASAIDGGGMPMVEQVQLLDDSLSGEARQAVDDAVRRVSVKRSADRMRQGIRGHSGGKGIAHFEQANRQMSARVAWLHAVANAHAP